MNKSVIIYLSGGIGNQLFQYIFGKYISQATNSELILECDFAYIIDSKYKRKFLLSSFIFVKTTTIKHKIIFLLYFANKKFFKLIFNLNLNKLFNNYFIYESNFNHLNNLNYKTLWVIGYWQHNKDIYNNDIMQNTIDTINFNIPPPESKNILNIGNNLFNTNSVALGLRFFEESENPEFHMGNTLKIQILKINYAISRMIKELPNCKFYIFCTKYNKEIFESLNIPNNAIYLTADKGYSDPKEILWLLSKIKNHIFTSSSFFWWGACFSRINYKKKEMSQIIYIIYNEKNSNLKFKDWIFV